MKINLVFDGNSLLSENNLFMPTGQTAYTWVNTVANILRYDHTVRCTNFAVAGQNIQAMIARGGLSDAAYDAPSDINILVAWEGTNQLFTTSPRASIALLSGYCKAKQTRGFKVLNGTVISRREAGSPADFETRRSRYNDELLRTYETFSDGCIDYGDPTTTFGSYNAPLDLLRFPDLTHFSPFGSGAAIVKTVDGIKRLLTR